MDEQKCIVTAPPLRYDDWEPAERRELFDTIDRYLVKHYGERCSEVNGGCATCVAWAARDVLNAAIFEM